MRYAILLVILILLSISARFIVVNENPTTDIFAPVSNDEVEAPSYVSPINIDYLRSVSFLGSEISTEEELSTGSNYKRYIASYTSDGYKINGLLTVPNQEPPEGGFSAIVFNHGYIPPNQYVTTEKYVAYVDYLARNGFVVFKIDLRGHGESEGVPTGSYFSPAYTIDAINALKSLQTLDYVNKDKIGIWGHSMAGNLALRAALVEPDIKAVVLMAGAVYSYEDFAEYRLNDTSYIRGPQPDTDESTDTTLVVEPSATIQRESSDNIRKLRESPKELDFNDEFWTSISLTKNIDYLEAPVQIHHAKNDDVVNIGYSSDLAKVLKEKDKTYEFHEYSGGGHNINSPYFEEMMQRTVDFYESNL